MREKEIVLKEKELDVIHKEAEDVKRNKALLEKEWECVNKAAISLAENENKARLLTEQYELKLSEIKI